MHVYVHVYVHVYIQSAPQLCAHTAMKAHNLASVAGHSEEEQNLMRNRHCPGHAEQLGCR